MRRGVLLTAGGLKKSRLQHILDSLLATDQTSTNVRMLNNGLVAPVVLNLHLGHRCSKTSEAEPDSVRMFPAPAGKRG